ncbi:zinc ABC transporter substrate-binding protein [Hoyosella sp. G463]|uniref:Zinc ABC transporter substrate-binding protein n=1 Tax=Lolliginicoccus lacisalsi TaxID=2742202 RepID=A0A927JBA0_9ACTN|nr:zinc ABC transporter substrate-binding protein [Lolliginicoccus lacisalsi]MBD8505921.1 zinc ABC transporter substrate-binding protein [Lolliginicoccus lacisalsi]
MRAQTRIGAATASLALASLGLVACGASADDQSSTGTTIVTSTTTWASIATIIGGEDFTIEALISDPAMGPHHYETSPRDIATIQDADLVLFNGGGYDQFVVDALESTSPAPRSINAYDIHLEHDHDADPGHTGDHDGHDQGTTPDDAHHDDHDAHDEGDHEAGDSHGEDSHDASSGEHGHDDGHGHGDDDGHGHGPVNEHIWFDLHTMSAVADELAGQLSEMNPDGAEAYQANAASFAEQIEALEDRAASIRAAHEGTEVAQTEPLTEYLLDELGLVDIAPREFVLAVENGTDPAASVTAAFSDLLDDREAAVLMYNATRESPTTRIMRDRAEANGTPIVAVAESVPAGMSYLEWMDSILDDVAEALDQE